SMLTETIDQLVWEKVQSAITLVDKARGTLSVSAPFTGSCLVSLPRATDEDVELAVRLARAAQPEWAARTVAERASIFLRFHDLLFSRQNEVLDLIQLETGKARRHAFEEVLDTAVVARHYAHHSAALLRPQRRRGALPVFTKTWEYRTPIGVV